MSWCMHLTGFSYCAELDQHSIGMLNELNGPQQTAVLYKEVWQKGKQQESTRGLPQFTQHRESETIL